MESHGGTTFCALAALQLSDQLDLLTNNQLEKMKRWLLFRQEGGFNGRPNKPVDTCYAFWIGAALRIIDSFDLRYTFISYFNLMTLLTNFFILNLAILEKIEIIFCRRKIQLSEAFQSGLDFPQIHFTLTLDCVD